MFWYHDYALGMNYYILDTEIFMHEMIGCLGFPSK